MTKQRFIFCAVIALLGISVLAFRPLQTFAEAEQTRLNKISQNCSSIKVQLRQIQKNDTKNRVQLGSYFESINTNLMLNLNLRLVKNNLANSDLAAMQSAFASERERFKNDYIGYSQELEALLNIDCKANPTDFSKQLNKTRTKRTAVHESIARLYEILNKHKATVEELKEAL